MYGDALLFEGSFGHPCLYAEEHVFLGQFGARFGLCWDYLGPKMVCGFEPCIKAQMDISFGAHFGAMLGLCGVHLGTHSGPQMNNLFGVMLWPCWDDVGVKIGFAFCIRA